MLLAGFESRLATWIYQACLLEATAPKPGNVHPDASFVDLCYADFVASAEVAAPALASASRVGVGAAVLAAVRVTQERVGTNTNLGIALLMAPLAAVPEGVTLQQGLPRVLAHLTMTDAENVYAAIRTVQPGGLGQVAEGDVNSVSAIDLLTAMGMAADRDRVARQYVTGFADVLEIGRPLLQEITRAAGQSPDRVIIDGEISSRFAAHPSLGSSDDIRLLSHQDPHRFDRIIQLHLEYLSRWPDSLIARKCGPSLADEARRRAAMALKAGGSLTQAGQVAIAELDAWLRADGHQRNPGTTADLVAATLFADLRESATSDSGSLTHDQ